MALQTKEDSLNCKVLWNFIDIQYILFTLYHCIVLIKMFTIIIIIPSFLLPKITIDHLVLKNKRLHDVQDDVSNLLLVTESLLHLSMDILFDPKEYNKIIINTKLDSGQPNVINRIFSNLTTQIHYLNLLKNNLSKSKRIIGKIRFTITVF